MRILCLLFLTSYAFAANQIIFLVSPPRSLSAGFLRMMQERGDFALFHEPSIAPYDAIHLAAAGITLLVIGILLTVKVIHLHLPPSVSKNCVIVLTFILGSCVTLLGVGTLASDC